MPVRSLNSSVLKWPDFETVDSAIRHWVSDLIVKEKGICKVGYFGSYARGDWGVGSDLDVIVIMKTANERWERRGISWDLTIVPVPVDLKIYSMNEWNMLPETNYFKRTLMREAVWIYNAGENSQDTL